MGTFIRSTVSAVLVTMALASSSLTAQDVTVSSTTSPRFFGGFGKLMSIAARFGGKNMNEPIRGTTYVAGHKMRTDTGDDAMIIDLDGERFINIDNKERSYTSMTFADMSAMVRSMGDSLKTARAQADSKGRSSGDKGEVDVRYEVKVDRPGERTKIAGAEAERVFMTITMIANATPEGEKTQEAGSMVFLVDEWVSRNAAQVTAMKEFQKLYLQKLGREFEASGKSLEAAFNANPQIKEGFAAAAKERAKVPGVPLRSTTYVSFVPAGMTFDRQLALGDVAAAPPAEAEKKGGGLRGMVRGIKKMADEADKADKEPAGPPRQATMMTITTEVDRIETGSVDGSLFVPPAGYREVKVRGR